MANCMVFHTQIASIMEVLANAAVAEICKLVDNDYKVFRLEMSQSQKENKGLRRKLQLMDWKVARERAERTIRERVPASRPSSVKILDRYRGMARVEEHLTVGHNSFVKPVGHNAWRDDQPIAIDEGTGTSSQHVIVIEVLEDRLWSSRRGLKETTHNTAETSRLKQRLEWCPLSQRTTLPPRPGPGPDVALRRWMAGG
ncbi:uncharacterized protein LOC118395546 isoform X6 [Oncorhynchus keta]|uniref:uncharacterized protein LOC118395546 isoform X6 n=1 Tax=Oncorhynchus keta TaxID=8018 RepID=UPI00227C31EE|nr:uncharacterized protein LOC118395546 isoform X6 [Oncorhynchus keta]